jgi:hypothetical protein
MAMLFSSARRMETFTVFLHTDDKNWLNLFATIFGSLV